MIVDELIIELQKQSDRGYGRKDVVIEGRGGNFHINSVQKNTNPDIEPDYLLIMADEAQVLEGS